MLPTHKNLATIVLSGEMDEFLTYFPAYASILEEYNARYQAKVQKNPKFDSFPLSTKIQAIKFEYQITNENKNIYNISARPDIIKGNAQLIEDATKAKLELLRIKKEQSKIKAEISKAKSKKNT